MIERKVGSLLLEKSKDELIDIILSQRTSIGKYKCIVNSKLGQISHFRLRIQKIIDTLNMVIAHPRSLDNSNKGRKK